MFELNDLPPQLPKALLARLAEVEPATVGHFRHSGFMDPALRAVIPERRVAGTAVTVRIPGPDSTLLHHVMGMVRPGDFLVIDRCGDTRHACWGGVVTYTAKKIGVAGAVIDGVATDFGEIRKFDQPVWCRGPSPITTKQLALGGALNVPVSCGGVMVAPGDAVLADENGIVVIKPEDVEAVMERALGMQRREVEVLKRIDAGEPLPQISGATAKMEAAIAAARGS
jgi:regulator of RNase E activity RraA